MRTRGYATVPVIARAGDRGSPSERTGDPELARVRAVFAERDRRAARAPGRGARSLAADIDGAIDRALAHAGPLAEMRILDVGCGHGVRLARLCARGADPRRVLGVDLIAERVAAARAAFPGVPYAQANAERLPSGDAAWDVILCSTLFSSILDGAVAARVAREIDRVLAPSAQAGVLWCDVRYPSPGNRAVRAMTRERVERLFPGYRLRLEAVALLPPLARRLGPLAPVAYPVLRSLPVLRSHYVGWLRKAAIDTVL